MNVDNNMTYGQVADRFFEMLAEYRYSLSNIQRFQLAVLRELPLHLFLSYGCEYFSDSAVDTILRTTSPWAAPLFKIFLTFAKTAKAQTIRQAFETFASKVSERRHNRLRCVLRNIAISEIHPTPIRTFSSELTKIYANMDFIRTKQTSDTVHYFIFKLSVMGLIPNVAPLIHEEPWMPDLLSKIQQGKALLSAPLLPSISDEDAFLLFLAWCRSEKDMSFLSIHCAQRYLREIIDSLKTYHCDTLRKLIPSMLVDALYARGLTTISVKHYTNHLKAFGECMIQLGLWERNPFQGIRLKPKQQPEKMPLSIAEQEALLHQALTAKRRFSPPFYHARDAALIALFLFTGIRQAELLSIHVDDISLENKTILIHGKGTRTLEAKPRFVFIDDPRCFSIIQTYLAHRNSVCPFLFVGDEGRGMSKAGLHGRLHVLAKEAGIERSVSAQLLRATFATTRIEAGMDPFALAQLMGHSSVYTTLRYYVFVREEFVHNAWRKANPLNQLGPIALPKGGVSHE